MRPPRRPGRNSPRRTSVSLTNASATSLPSSTTSAGTRTGSLIISTGNATMASTVSQKTPPQRSAPWRTALLFLILGAGFWIGGITVRAVLGGDMLKFGTLEFEDYLSPDVERELFRLISIVSIVILVSYVVVLVSSVIFLLTSPLRLREHGWLMMSAILFYIFVPVEMFTGYLDAKMI